MKIQDIVQYTYMPGKRAKCPPFLRAVINGGDFRAGNYYKRLTITGQGIQNCIMNYINFNKSNEKINTYIHIEMHTTNTTLLGAA